MPPPVCITAIVSGLCAVLRNVMPVGVLLAPTLLGAAEGDEAAARRHFIRCWHLEHDYYELRRRIAETAVVWRRQELEQQWAEVRDQRRRLCSMGW